MRIDAPIITGSFSLNGDALIDLNVLTTTGSNTFIGNQSIIGAISASALTGSIDFTNLTNSPTLVSGSSQVIDILSSLNSVTASFTPRISNLESKSASVDISITNINLYTSSQDTKNTTLGSYTGSNDTKWTSIGNLTGSYATTGSNTFFGTQTYSGSVYIANDLIVQGSSSIQYISASSVSIGTNIVQLNTANPSVRYAGLTIIDSGSIGGSGSFLYDSVQDEFIFVHRGNGTNITSSHFVLGPETIDDLGNEIYLTNNRLPKGTGKEHLIDSCITDNGSSICFNTPTGSFSGKLGVGASNPKWLLEVCANNGCTGAGQYPGISINNGCTTGDSGLYFYNGLTQMGGMETSNSTGNILINSQAALSLQTANTNRISIANTGATTLSCQLYLDGCNRDMVFVKSNNSTFSRLFYAGQNQIVFHNGNTTACGGAWGLNNYEDTVGLFRVYNSGTSCWFGDKVITGHVGINCNTSSSKLTINNGECVGSIRFYGSNSSYTSQVGWYDSTNVDSNSDGVGGQRVALIEIGTVAGTGTGCRGANMALYTHQANGTLKLPLLLMHNGNVCLPQGNLYTTCTLFAPGTPIQVVTGNATVSSGGAGTGYSMGTNEAGNQTPLYNQGLNIAQTTFTPKSATSKILIMTNNVVMWERSNVSDHFYLWAANHTDGTILVKSGQYLQLFGPGSSNGGIINLNGAASSWGTSTKTIIFRIGTTGSSGAYYEWNPYYGASGFNADTVGNFTWTIMEIAQ